MYLNLYFNKWNLRSMLPFDIMHVVTSKSICLLAHLCIFHMSSMGVEDTPVTTLWEALLINLKGLVEDWQRIRYGGQEDGCHQYQWEIMNHLYSRFVKCSSNDLYGMLYSFSVLYNNGLHLSFMTDNWFQIKCVCEIFCQHYVTLRRLHIK